MERSSPVHFAISRLDLGTLRWNRNGISIKRKLRVQATHFYKKKTPSTDYCMCICTLVLITPKIHAENSNKHTHTHFSYLLSVACVAAW